MSRRFDVPEPVNLIGGFSCMLTANERNEWHDFLNERAEFKEAMQVDIDYACAYAAVVGGADRESSMRTASEKSRVLRDQLYTIGKQWYADLVARTDKNRETADAD